MIYLVRHGQASFGEEDYDKLSSIGLEQSLMVGRSFVERGLSFDLAYRGSLKRHRQTLETCFAKAIPEVRVDSGLNELDHRMLLARHRPQWSALDWANFLESAEDPKRAFQEEFKKAFLRWLSGKYDDEYDETWAMFCQRSYETIQSIAQLNYSPVAVFTSGGPIAAVVGRILELADPAIARLAWRIANGSITCLEVRGNHLNLLTFNEAAHLQRADLPHLFTYR